MRNRKPIIGIYKITNQVIGVDDFSMSINKTSNAGATFLVLEHGRGKTIEYAIKL